MGSKQAFAKQLRSSMTDAERLLWFHLRGHRLNGVKFKRQQPIGDYIVDFVCFERRLVIEVDGGQHLENASDQQREAWLRGQGFEVLRFWNNEVLGQTEAVLEKILGALPLSPTPLPRGERGKAEEIAGAARIKNLERLRWRCRRGLLELDIVLGRFVEQHYASLNEDQQIAFDELLDEPDTVLWDMVAGRKQAAQNAQQDVLEKIRVV